MTSNPSPPFARPALLRSLGEGAVAVVVGQALTAMAVADDPFRGTLAILPLVVAALRAVERHYVGRHRGARRTPPFEGWIAAGILAGLVATTLARSRLGLAATDWFLAAGFLLLLGQRAARLLLALRPCLGQRLSRRPAAAFFWLPFIVYLAIQPWSAEHRQPDGDEPYFLLLAHSLAYDLDLDLTNNYTADWQRFMERAIEPQIFDPVGANGEQYSRHSFLLPMVLAPAYRLAGRAGAMAMIAALTAALAWMLLRLARHYTPRKPGAALLAYGIFAFCPPLLLYSYQIWVEVPAALLLALALDGLLALRRGKRWHVGGVVALLLPLALLPVLKLRFVFLAIPLFLLACWRARPGKRVLVRWSLGLGTAAAGLLLFNVLRFGNPLRLHAWTELDLFKYSSADFFRGAVGIFYDAAFGLFPHAPVWLLLLPALGLLVQRRSALLMDAVVISLPYLLFVIPRIEWYGGWSPPFRYHLVFLPLLALGLVPLLERRSYPWVRTLFVAFGAATLVLTVLWVVIPGWTYNFADGRTHLLDQAGVRLVTDVARLFPSTVRPRPATWIWLAASLFLIPLGVWRGSRRRAWPSPTWGVAALLLLLAALPLISRLIPTGVIELEDAFVGKRLGSVHPPPWVLQRPIYTGGWAVPAGGRLAAPVIPGGERVTIKISGRLAAEEGSGRLWLEAGDTRLAPWDAGPKWTTATLGPFFGPAGARLVIRGDASLSDPVIVDRAEMVWQ